MPCLLLWSRYERIPFNPTFVLDTHLNAKPVDFAMESNLARPGARELKGELVSSWHEP